MSHFKNSVRHIMGSRLMGPRLMGSRLMGSFGTKLTHIEKVPDASQQHSVNGISDGLAKSDPIKRCNFKACLYVITMGQTFLVINANDNFNQIYQIVF